MATAPEDSDPPLNANLILIAIQSLAAIIAEQRIIIDKQQDMIETLKAAQHTIVYHATAAIRPKGTEDMPFSLDIDGSTQVLSMAATLQPSGTAPRPPSTVTFTSSDATRMTVAAKDDGTGSIAEAVGTALSNGPYEVVVSYTRVSDAVVVTDTFSGNVSGILPDEPTSFLLDAVATAKAPTFRRRR